MYWKSNDYDKMAQLVIDIYIDYNITSFPVDEKEICKKMGLKLIPYSAYTEKEQELLRKRSEDGFFCPATKTTPLMKLVVGFCPILCNVLQNEVYP